MVMYSAEAIHYSDQFYKDPQVFNPHRFDGAESNTLQDDHWYGFGVGPRACPAVRLEYFEIKFSHDFYHHLIQTFFRWAFIAMKIFIAEMLLKYKVVRTDKTLDRKEWEIAFVGQSLGSSKPLLVGFERR